MQLIQFLAAWLFPGAQCFLVEMATADSSELDRASSSSSPSPSFSVIAAGSGSSLSSPSTTSSSSDDGHRGFFKSRSRMESPSTTPLCFGGSSGAGRRLLRVRGSSRARAPAKQEEEEEAAAATKAPKAKGDVVGRYLRKISRRLRKARSDGKGSPSSMAAAAVDDTDRERAESVARAISYCKDTLRRGRSRSRSPSPPPPPPSPSLDEWLHDRQEEIIATAAVQCDECSDPVPRPSPRRPRRAAGWPLGMQTMAKRFKESPCSATPSPEYDSLAAITVAHGEEDESPHHGHGCRGESMSSLEEMEFLKTFDGDEEMINHHFITVEL